MDKQTLLPLQFVLKGFHYLSVMLPCNQNAAWIINVGYIYFGFYFIFIFLVLKHKNNKFNHIVYCLVEIWCLSSIAPILASLAF